MAFLVEFGVPLNPYRSFIPPAPRQLSPGSPRSPYPCAGSRLRGAALTPQTHPGGPPPRASPWETQGETRERAQAAALLLKVQLLLLNNNKNQYIGSSPLKREAGHPFATQTRTFIITINDNWPLYVFVVFIRQKPACVCVPTYGNFGETQAALLHGKRRGPSSRCSPSSPLPLSTSGTSAADPAHKRTMAEMVAGMVLPPHKRTGQTRTVCPTFVLRLY